ncbi:hypothetical protein [Streptomyces sp. N2A]|uniref:hypothetical protein n=1 Tax=Streptomyces sp. N2A TaxID=3073936 RepID=UPI0028706BFD|nr:hypothetical protein [Streptomyces sp. N2A]
MADDGGHLVIATDLELGAGLINAAESLMRACAREFGPPVTVVRHYPPYGLPAPDHDTFDVLPLDEKGIARPKRCNAHIGARLSRPARRGLREAAGVTHWAVRVIRTTNSCHPLDIMGHFE